MWMDKNTSLSKKLISRQLDPNNDENNRDEAERMELVKQDFFQSDKNGDGYLNRLEYKNFLSQQLIRTRNDANDLN